MGNRGCLHDAEGRIVKQTWGHERWVCCLTSFKGRRRLPMPTGRYTALFFLDEAVALAAGHRPCCECRRSDYKAFVGAWRIARGIDPTCKLGADDIDTALHAMRVGPGKRQARHGGCLGDLPDGTFVAIGKEPASAFLLLDGMLHRWFHGGYSEVMRAEGVGDVEVLTPSPTVDVLRAGYRPAIHPSAAVGLSRAPVG